MPIRQDVPRPWRHPAFAEMRREMEELREENRQLRGLIAPVAWLPRSWRLTPAETRLVVALANTSGPLGRERARLVIGSMVREPGEQSLDVHISRARSKCRAFGVEIRTIRYVGLFLAPQGRQIVREALDAVAAGLAA